MFFHNRAFPVVDLGSAWIHIFGDGWTLENGQWTMIPSRSQCHFACAFEVFMIAVRSFSSSVQSFSMEPDSFSLK